MNDILQEDPTTELNTIISYWFGPTNQDKPFDMQSIEMQRWYGKSPEIDQDIKQHFEGLYVQLHSNEVASVFERRPILDQLAVIITLDQFPRNMYRESAKMYQADAKALELCDILVNNSEFEQLDLFKQMFGTLPMMHAEDKAMQRETVRHFTRFVDHAKSTASPNLDFFENALGFALQHQKIVDRFGRYPHRNEILGRTSTAEELEFLQQPDSSF